jgi:lysophospholipase L1-like esterase
MGCGQGAADHATPSTATDSGPPCVRGEVKPDQVVMIGDSYLDPAYSNTALELFVDARGGGALPANMTYRHYSRGTASMAGGSLQSTIPYQFTGEALTDRTVANPADVDTVIMVGGINDLLGNPSCETSAAPGNAGCSTTIQSVTDAIATLGRTMAMHGVKHVVFLFYPHFDPGGGGLMVAPAPAIDETVDYAYQLVEQACCGTTFVSSQENYTCKGSALGPECLFIDTRPAFEGQAGDCLGPDHVNPSPTGAKTLAALMWWAMVDNCIAQ